MKAHDIVPKLYLERLLDKAFLFLGTYHIALFSGIFFGILAHGFVFANKLINHDEIYNLFGKGATIDSGRWGLGALDSIFPNYSMPWVYGLLTVLLIAVSACLIAHIFAIHSRLLQGLLAGSIIVFPLWTSTFAFMFTSSSYGVAFLMAVLSVAFLRRNHPFYWICALGCGIFSVAIYQAYIAIIASLLVLSLIQDLLLEEDLLPAVRRGFFYVGFLILTLGLYYLAAQAILVLKDVAFNKYASERNSFDLASLPRNLLLAYSHFFSAIETGEHALVPTLFSQKLHRFCIAACGFLLLVLFFVRRMKLSRILLVLALIAVFPLAVNCMYLFTPEAAIHTLVLCGFLSVSVFFIVIANLCLSVLPQNHSIDLLRQIVLSLLVFALFAMIISNTYFANEAYLQLHLQYENTYAFYTSLISDIRMQPGFDEDTKLAVIGRWNYPDYFFRKFNFTFQLFGHLNSSPTEYSMDRFMEYYVGFPISFVSRREAAEIQKSAVFEQMPVYPYYGSIRMLDNTLVVKLS